jgi:glycosyltransferase involved in cell wall biosynthesis
MITGHDIVYISSIEWNFLWQVHQEIAIRLAKAGNRILYVENTGVRSPGIKDAKRITSRLRRWATATRSSGVREVVPNVFVCSPLVLPPFGNALRRELNKRVFLSAVKKTASHLGMRNPLLWTYLPTDTAVDLIGLLREPESRTIYYCAADFSLLSPHPSLLRESEEQLVRDSDVVFAQCRSLADHCRQWNNDVHVFPAGVDLEVFPVQTSINRPKYNSALGTVGELVPPDLREALTDGSIRRPVIGYVGGIHRFVDQGLIATMARQRPEWSIVLIGPAQCSVEELTGLKNVFLLGVKPHRDLAAYMRYFDVCMIPYLNTSETAAVVPVKLNEYLAMGKPVVATNLPTLEEFNAKHDVMALSDAVGFTAAIENILKRNPLEGSQHRRRIAEQNDWKVRMEAMSTLIERSLRPEIEALQVVAAV